jgi:hypothetical protein
MYSIYEEEHWAPLSFLMYPLSLRHAGGILSESFVEYLEELTSPIPLTSLDFHHIEEYYLKRLFRHLPVLHTLSYQPCFGETELRISRKILYDALAQYKPTLQSLTISSAGGSGHHGGLHLWLVCLFR